MPATLSLLTPSISRPRPINQFASIAPMEPDAWRDRSFSVGTSNHSDAGMASPGEPLFLVPQS